MMKNTELLLGYDYDKWYGYGDKDKITIEISSEKNSHCLCVGKSGSGKSYYTVIMCARIASIDDLSQIYFADFKLDSTYSFLKGCPRYYSYFDSMQALSNVYEIMHQRQNGDTSRRPITLFIDEYTAFISALQNRDKKEAEKATRMLSELLMLGRTLAIRIVITTQTAYAEIFPKGSRVNFGVIVILGDYETDNNYEILLPQKYIAQIGERHFGLGEGVVMLQNSQLRYMKVPEITNEEKLQRVCIEALTR